MYWVRIQSNVHANVIDLLSLYVLFSQTYRSFDDTLENRFFQILSSSRAYLRVMYEKTKGKVPLGPLLGKQNIQAKEVYTLRDLLTHYKALSCHISGRKNGGTRTVSIYLVDICRFWT